MQTQRHVLLATLIDSYFIVDSSTNSNNIDVHFHHTRIITMMPAGGFTYETIPTLLSNADAECGILWNSPLNATPVIAAIVSNALQADPILSSSSVSFIRNDFRSVFELSQ